MSLASQTGTRTPADSAGARARIESVVGELVDLSSTEPHLLQFRSRAGAHQFLPLYEQVLGRLKPGARVLDWGSGNGHFAYFLERSGFDVTAYSYRAPLRRLADRDYRCVEGLDDPVRLPFPDDSFDAVCSVGVLEHVRETGGREDASLAEVVRVLTPAGRFFCFHLPNRASAVEHLAELVPGKHVHAYRYDEAGVRRLFGDAGLEIEWLERYGVLPRNLAGRLPGALRTSSRVARAWDRIDRGLLRILGPVSQNFGIVARPRAGAEAGPVAGHASPSADALPSRR